MHNSLQDQAQGERRREELTVRLGRFLLLWNENPGVYHLFIEHTYASILLLCDRDGDKVDILWNEDIVESSTPSCLLISPALDLPDLSDSFAKSTSTQPIITFVPGSSVSASRYVISTKSPKSRAFVVRVDLTRTSGAGASPRHQEGYDGDRELPEWLTVAYY